jgi:hypothetical protein
MRKLSKAPFALLALLVLASVAASKQPAANQQSNEKSIVEPKYVDDVYQLTDNGDLILLDSQKPVRNVKSGFTGGSITYVYGGAASSTRVNTPSPTFVIRLAPAVNSASIILGLNRLKPTKKNRELVMVQMTGALSDFKDKGKRPENFELAFSDNGPNSVKIKVVGKLEPGEYAIRTKSGTTFLFGIDLKE